jgi:hypothetical protein
VQQPKAAVHVSHSSMAMMKSQFMMLSLLLMLMVSALDGCFGMHFGRASWLSTTFT